MPALQPTSVSASSCYSNVYELTARRRAEGREGGTGRRGQARGGGGGGGRRTRRRRRSCSRTTTNTTTNSRRLRFRTGFRFLHCNGVVRSLGFSQCFSASEGRRTRVCGWCVSASQGRPSVVCASCCRVCSAPAREDPRVLCVEAYLEAYAEAEAEADAEAEAEAG